MPRSFHKYTEMLLNMELKLCKQVDYFTIKCIYNGYVDSQNCVIYVAGTMSMQNVLIDLTIPIGQLQNTSRYQTVNNC